MHIYTILYKKVDFLTRYFFKKMEYNDGSQFSDDQFFMSSAYLDTPFDTTSAEILKRNAKIVEKTQRQTSFKTVSEQEIEDIIQQEVRNKIRKQVEKYFDHKSGEVEESTFDSFEGGRTYFSRISDGNSDVDDELMFSSKKQETQLILIILIVVLFILSVFQYAQTQSLRDNLYNILAMHKNSVGLAK